MPLISYEKFSKPVKGSAFFLKPAIGFRPGIGYNEGNINWFIQYYGGFDEFKTLFQL